MPVIVFIGMLGGKAHTAPSGGCEVNEAACAIKEARPTELPHSESLVNDFAVRRAMNLVRPSSSQTLFGPHLYASNLSVAFECVYNLADLGLVGNHVLAWHGCSVCNLELPYFAR